MLSVFFNKSKPIQYIILSVMLILVFVASQFQANADGLYSTSLLEKLGVFLALLLSVFIFDFFVTKNKLTQKNSFNILLYLVFLAIFPNVVTHGNIIFANLFLIFATRRILSLRSQREVKKKLFDAAFWITLASLFYFWSILFFILVFASLLVYGFTEIKNYIIPTIGALTVLIIAVAYRIILDISLFEGLGTLGSFSLDFSSLNTKRIIIGATVMLSFGVWSFFFYLNNIKSKMKSNRPSFKLIAISAIIALSIIVLAPKKNGSEFVFLFTPLAIIITNYIEVISERWFKESFLWLLVLTPLVILVL
ncbi:MAG: DUF6427 family protein [Bacteroidota bacterium]